MTKVTVEVNFWPKNWQLNKEDQEKTLIQKQAAVRRES